MKDIKLDKEVIESCRVFANKRTEDSLKLYQFRGEHRRQKIFSDIFQGTLAEFAVQKALSEIAPMSAPDLTIYDAKDKSYSKDLEFNGIHIHVKSQSIDSSKRYGISWVFQLRDSLLESSDPNAVLALCLIHGHLEVKVLGYLKAKDACFKDLKIRHYGKTKKAVYFEDVKDYIMNEEELYEYSENLKKEKSGN